MSPILMALKDIDWGFTATVVIAGISIVLGVLILLIIVFYLFGFIVSRLEKRSKDKTAAKKDNQAIKAPLPPVIKPPVVPEAPAVEQGISGEVVAAIAAAVAMTDGPTAVVRSIKKKNVGGRNPWAQAAMNDNTRPF